MADRPSKGIYRCPLHGDFATDAVYNIDGEIKAPVECPLFLQDTVGTKACGLSSPLTRAPWLLDGVAKPHIHGMSEDEVLRLLERLRARRTEHESVQADMMKTATGMTKSNYIDVDVQREERAQFEQFESEEREAMREFINAQWA